MRITSLCSAAPWGGMRLRYAVIVALLTLICSAHAAPPKYRATQISAGGSQSLAYGINNLGDVVGEAYTADDVPRAVRSIERGRRAVAADHLHALPAVD